MKRTYFSALVLAFGMACDAGPEGVEGSHAVETNGASLTGAELSEDLLWRSNCGPAATTTCRCRVLGPCNAQGTNLDVFDAFQGANVAPNRCMQRARETFFACGNRPDQAMRAVFTIGNVPNTVKQTTFVGGCRITGHCRSTGTRINALDGDAASHADEARCLQRDEAYFASCGNQAGQVVRAVFERTGASSQTDGCTGTLTELERIRCLEARLR